MLRSKLFQAFSLVAILLAATACTNDNLDDGGSADVVLEIETLETAPVTAALDTTTGQCTFTVAKWKFGARNLPKNELAIESGFNDISLISVTITYNWINPSNVTPQRVVGLGGIVIPVDGSADLEFEPIALDDVTPALESSTANLTMFFEGITIEGSRVRQTVLRQLHVNACQ